MTNGEMLSHIDHTLLAPCATWPEIQQLCEEAIQYKTASVCIPSSYVSRVAEEYRSNLVICTVIGFPLGYQSTAGKIAEAKCAVDDGAGEIDMVINLGDVKNKDFDRITREIASVKQTIGDKVLKVIVETCYLTKAEKIELCRCVTAGGAQYIKTSTGFGTGGASLEDIELFKQFIGDGVKIKASGGIRTAADIQAYLDIGCDRVGSSSAIKALA